MIVFDDDEYLYRIYCDQCGKHIETPHEPCPQDIIDAIRDNDWITFHISRAKLHICSGECKNEFNKEIIELAERIKG